jgi:hypothetical protein
MRPLTVLASPWSALHRNRERIQAATFGTFDGATSSYGVTFAMFAQHQAPAAFVAPIVGLAIASAAGMGGGEAASGEGSDLGRLKAYAVTFGVLAVAIGVTSAISVMLPGSGG